MPSRRQIITQIAGAAAVPLLSAPTVLRAANSAERSFRIIRDGTDIGFHKVSLSRSGDEIQAAIDIEIKVKVFGITAYRYEMTNRETWRAGRLVGLNSVVNDDGENAFSRAKMDGDRLLIDGSSYQGEAPANAATTSYWSHDFLKRDTWISTQTGALLKVTRMKTGAGAVRLADAWQPTDRWAIRGDFDVTLHYVAGEWAGVDFDAGGEVASYAPDAVGPNLQPVWNASL